MKKSIIAVAVLGAMSGAAFAQVAPNNITLYGVVDIAFLRTSVEETGQQTKTTTGLNAGNQSGNRWGLRGSEDLGGGLKANFRLESGFNIVNGNSGQGGRLFGRHAWVGLSGGFGEVRLGRQTLFSSAEVTGIADPFDNGFGIAGFQLLSSAAGTQRNDNTVTYRTPAMNGLQGAVYYTFGGKATPVPASESKDNWLGGGVTYSAGPLNLGLSYDTKDSSTNAAGSRDDKWLNLVGSYNFGAAKVHAGYVKEETTGEDKTGYILGATVPLGGGELLAAYQSGKVDIIAAGVADPKIRGLSVGYTYALSKRTNVFTYVAQGKETEPGYTKKTREVNFGIRHMF